MKRYALVAVGRLKTPHWQAAAAEYWKRLSRNVKLEERAVRDADAALPPGERKKWEAERILKQIKLNDMLICLDETGRTFTSEDFARFLDRFHAMGKTPCFVIGGAFGLDAAVIRAAAHVVSFGRMTFPHELARVLLFEQLYRAENILAGTGYHH